MVKCVLLPTPPPPHRRRRLGLDSDAPGQLPVAFAFGTGEGWDRLAVYFCTAAGHLYTLCPVVPFGEGSTWHHYSCGIPTTHGPRRGVQLQPVAAA